MGWSYEHRDKGASNLDFFREQFAEGYELLDGATVGSTFYGALKQPDGTVTATVILTRWAPRAYFNFGTKSMTESWGPTEARCPERILDMLSPTEVLFGHPEYKTVCDEHRVGCATQYGPENEGKWSGWDKTCVNQRLEPTGSASSAIEWRERCRTYHARVAKVKRGTIIRLSALSADTYEAVDLRRNLFREVGSFGRQVRITWWRTANFEVIPAA